VAKSSQGVEVLLTGAWGEYGLGEVVSASLDGVQADIVEITPRTATARDKLFRPADRDNGTASFTFRRLDIISFTNVGSTCTLEIGQAPDIVYWQGPATIQSFAWRASVGELQEYSAVFKLGATP
jgi:hypothetical protein